MTTNERILDTIDRMQNAGSVVVFGAAKRAKLMIPLCEAYVSKDKISVAVSKLGGGYEAVCLWL